MAVAQPSALTSVFGLISANFYRRPREDSNLRTRLRRSSCIVFSVYRVPHSASELRFLSTRSPGIHQVVVSRLTIPLTTMLALAPTMERDLYRVLTATADN